MDYIIQTEGLDYFFGKTQVLNNVSLKVSEGSIYGFVGPNGAGKTTTIRTLLGLYPVNKDKIFLFGEDIQKDRINILSRIGAMVETPSHYEHLSGKDNLEIARILYKTDRKRVSEVLDIVGLTKYSSKKVSKYSLGMKQRLGIAWALMAKPRILILDEPTNGLDPHGIKEIRELLGYLNREFGTTILISSHILSELERLVTHVGIINNGSLMFQGNLSDLYDLSIEKLVIESDEQEKLINVLSGSGYKSIAEGESAVKITVKNKNEINELAKLFVKNEVPFYGLYSEQKTLEEIFFDLMKK